MIYLSKNNQTKVITDNVVNFIPETIEVYLGEVFVGSFENLALNKQYIIFNIPALDMEEKEYEMRIYNHSALIKKELVIVKDLSELTIKSVSNTKKIKMYERE